MRAIALLIAFTFALPFAESGQSRKLSPLPPQLQDTIPKFSLLTIDNKPGINRDSLKANANSANAKRVVLSFFATWCINCREEFKLLKDNAGELKKNGAQVYLINVGENIHDTGSKASGMASKYAGKSFPLYFDPNGNLLRRSGFDVKNASLPIIMILDSDLKVLAVLDRIGNDDFPRILWGKL